MTKLLRAHNARGAHLRAIDSGLRLLVQLERLANLLSVHFDCLAILSLNPGQAQGAPPREEETSQPSETRAKGRRGWKLGETKKERETEMGYFKAPLLVQQIACLHVSSPSLQSARLDGR